MVRLIATESHATSYSLNPLLRELIYLHLGFGSVPGFGTLKSEKGANVLPDLLGVDSILLDTLEQRLKGLGVTDILDQLAELIASDDLHNRTEYWAVLHLIIEQGTEVLLRQDSNNVIQETIQTTGCYSLVGRGCLYKVLL